MGEPVPDNSSKITGDAAAAVDDDDDVSVTLICKDGKEVQASRKRLVRLSPVFETLLTNKWKEGHERSVSVNWDSDLVEKIVSYPPMEDFGRCYDTNDQVRPLDRFMEFVEFAVYYNSQDLLKRCCTTLTAKRQYLLTGVSFFKIFVVANDNDVFGMVHECLTMFRMKIFDFIVEEGFAEAYYRFLERGRKDKGVHRLIRYIENYKEMGTRPSGDLAMPISPCNGCSNCKALPRTE